MRILGIDEAGRGSVLGSMFLCGFVCSDKDLPQLKKLGVKDSKSFGSTDRARQKRCLLSKKLKENFSYQIEEVSAAKIDTFVKQKGLNQLEREVACKIIDSNQCDRIVLDGINIFQPLTKKYLHALAINQGDKKQLSIAAASILAKDARDTSLKKLYQPFQATYGNISGGGYPNQASLDFIIWYNKNYGRLPSFYRKQYHWNKLDSFLKKLEVNGTKNAYIETGREKFFVGRSNF